MAIIEIELKNGQTKRVEFDGTPTQADIEEIANSLDNTSMPEPEPITQNTVLKGGVEKTVNLSPSNIMHKVSDTLGAGVLAPIKMAKDGQTYNEAFNTIKQDVQDERQNNLLSKVGDSLLDMAVYSRVNPFKIANPIANVGVNGAVQGALINEIDSLKNKGLNVAENLKDLGIGGVVGAGTGALGAYGLGKLANAIENPAFQNKLANAIEFLTSVPKKYTDRALKAEMSNKSILGNEFNADETYKRIGDMLRQAKDRLPNKEEFSTQFNNLGKKAYDGFNKEQIKLEQKIREVLNKMEKSQNTLDIQNLRNSLKDTINSFANGGDINPALETAGREIKDVKRLLGIMTPEEKTSALNGLLKPVKEKAGFTDTFDREAESIALDLLSQQTGKDKGYLRMILKASQPQHAKQMQFESLMNEIETKPFDVLNIDGARYYSKFPELYQIMEDSTSNKDFMTNLASRVSGRNFKKYNYDNDPLASTIEESDKRFADIASKFIEDVQNPNVSELAYSNALNNFNKQFNGLDDTLKDEYLMDLTKLFDDTDNLLNPKVKAIDLHNIKELLYDKANYDISNSGIRNNALKAMANDINQTLRNANPEYAQANDTYKLLKDVEQAFGGAQGVNPNTIASKLMAYGDKGNILSNMDTRLRNLDAVVDTPNKFFLETKDLKKRMNSIDDILTEIGNKGYERNPRLMDNINDTRREDALRLLQQKTGVNFIDDLENARAREAFEKLTPGQGGGSGSSQGYANLFRNALTTSIAGSIGGGWQGSLGGAMLGLLGSSPKFMGKSTIKNLGTLYRLGNQEIPTWLIPLLFGTQKNLTSQKAQ